MARTSKNRTDDPGETGVEVVQKERQIAHSQIQQLQDSVQALRDELEAQQVTTRKLVHSERQSAAAEIEQLKGAVTALREE